VSEPGVPASADQLSLADWRRRIADLYAEVRRIAATDAPGAWALWRTTREALFREHPDSPVPASLRGSFQARHWPYDEALRFVLPVLDSAPEAEPGIRLSMAPGTTLQLPMSVGEALDFRRIGWIEVPFAASPRRLALYWMAGYSGGLFLPFRDSTNGDATYAAGRYVLDTAKSADLGADVAGRLVVDFNFAFHPSCAFDPVWSCPLAPPENRLDLPVEAGERLR
jgi:uncharacterized protein (DUF1684 family)